MMIQTNDPRREESAAAERSLSELVDTHPACETPTELYLDLLKRALTRMLVGRQLERQTLRARFLPKRMAIGLAQALLKRFGLELVTLVKCSPEDYLESGDESRNRAEDAETMLGTRQFDQMQACIERVVQEDVPGDFLEAGVWRGGMTIFMRGALKGYGDKARRVWVADSFQGLPEPDRSVESFGWKAGDMTATLQEVKSNFARYRLLDDQVRFLPGFFADSLPSAPIEALAILRVDADLYESTRDVLRSLYPRLSTGGYAVFDDYQNLPDCRRAIDEYRDEHGIDDEIIEIDSRAVYWRKRA